MLQGARTWFFHNSPTIVSTGVVGGPFEAEGQLLHDFDLVVEDIWLEQDSFEKAQRMMFERACEIAMNKYGIEATNIDFFIGGDLINQMTPTTFTAEKLTVPYLGLFSACATSMQGLALAALILHNRGAKYILTGTASHNAATERQFRYPTEYGGQKPPTAQWTVTGAGCALVTTKENGIGPKITSATMGSVVNMGITNPFNMGGAMAPAAAHTIIQHIHDLKIEPEYYDLIITGDLGKVGLEATYDYLKEKGLTIQDGHIVDCGLTIYSEDQEVYAGASGTASSAVATYGHFLNRMKKGELNRILVVATGSLHSPLSVQQKESIPCIAHAVSIERSSLPKRSQ